MDTAADLLAEARWEMEGVRRAKQRYEEAAASKDPSTLPSGQRLLREVIPPLYKAIRELQVEGLQAISAKTGTVPAWAWPIQTLDAGTLALITVTVALNVARGSTDEDRSVTTVVEQIGAAVRDEVNYRAWVTEQMAVNAEAKEAQDWEHRDLLTELKRTYPTVNRRTWLRWRKKVDATMTEAWDEATRIHLGAALLSRLELASSGRFMLDTVRAKGVRTQRVLSLSPETLAIMQDVEQRASVSRPLRMPMIIPPRPWRYVED